MTSGLGAAVLAAICVAETARAGTPADCLAALDSLAVAYSLPPRPPAGIEWPVEVDGPLGGVTYVPLAGLRALVLDCSLVYSLAIAGKLLVDEGVRTAYFGDAYHRRVVKGTTRASKHSFGLALDLHRFADASGRALSVDADYPTGLGRGRDCLGRPTDERGLELRRIFCRMARSELFKMVLDPDFDEDHRDHFHVQALPWRDRDDLDWR